MRWWVFVWALVLAPGCSGRAERDSVRASSAGQGGSSAHGGSSSSGGAGGVMSDCYSYLFTDADGDGYGLAPFAERLVSCLTVAPDGYAFNGADCDDTDATRWQSAALDADGDGLPDPTTLACFGELPPGYLISPWDPDCDDTNPAAQRVYYLDADHDGIGSSAPEAELCAGPEAPSGYVDIPGDCDDGDALRNPLAGEQWEDGVDSDCNDVDDPFDCSSDIFECACSTRSGPLIAKTPTCQGAADLSLHLLQTCTFCGPEVVFVSVYNSGDLPSSEFRIDVEVMPTSDGRMTDIQPPPVVLPALAPGQAMGPIVLPPVWPLSGARITSAGDCDLGNDAIELATGYAECFR